MLKTEQKISLGSILITFSLLFIASLILIQYSEIVIPFYEFMFLVCGIILGLGITLAISGLADQRRTKINL